jgi:hypothetical protein
MTFAAEEAGQILSQDARGRVLVSRERRESLLEEYDRSGMSGVKFAQSAKVRRKKRQNAPLEPRRRQNVTRFNSQGFGIRLTGPGSHCHDVLR